MQSSTTENYINDHSKSIVTTKSIPNNSNQSNIDFNNNSTQYNDNLFKNVMQPNVYVETNTIEPLNSNIGISQATQFDPTVRTSNHDITTYKKGYPVYNCAIDGPNESNIYDPRFTGYGTNYRTYIDNMTGQPRFYYDDVMIHRQNNYLTRNKLDFTSFGSHINQAEQKYSNMDIRQMAHQDFDNNTINHRSDLQSSLMRKINANSWQRKHAPIY